MIYMAVIGPLPSCGCLVSVRGAVARPKQPRRCLWTDHFGSSLPSRAGLNRSRAA
jgi:hypothetical protein